MSDRPTRRFVVEVDAGGACNVIDECGRETGRLTLGEMLEQMVSVCHPALGPSRHTMLTPEGWEARWRVAEARRERRLLEEIAAVALDLATPANETIQ